MNANEMSEAQEPTRSGQPHPQNAFDALTSVRTHEALARFGGDQERYRHWLMDFVNHGPNATAQIRQAITGGSTEAAIKLAHALKGRTGMLGMNELHSISETLEISLRNGESPSMWLDELESAIETMRRDIENALEPPLT